MGTLIGFIIFILFCIVIVQIARISELSSALRGEEHIRYERSRRIGNALMLFLAVLLIGTIGSAIYYKNVMLGYGPNKPASAHGGSIDNLFNITLAITGLVFVVTQIALFYFTWKYRERKGHKADFISHDNKLELIWTATPALVLAVLIINGITSWNEIMGDVKEDEDYIEVEATGMQFAWILRYPGADGALGGRDFRQITGTNPLGQVWTDVKNLDDIHANDLVLPKGKKVRVRITSRDVLHNFYLPHFRLKMDAVPGMPTYFVFTPTLTTEEYRQNLKEYPEYQVPDDPTDPNGPKKWEAFEYELACAELCGNGHYSMRKVVKIVEPREYEAWLAQQNSYYLSTIRHSDNDPFKDQLLDIEVAQYGRELKTNFVEAMDRDEKVFTMPHVNFVTGSAELTANSVYQVGNLAEVLLEYDDVNIELSGHTDNTGNAAENLILSKSRAEAVKAELIELGVAADRLRAVGYGQTRPIESNDTEMGRAQNRRTEIKIL